MSYDLNVYGKSALDMSALLNLIRADPDLDVTVETAANGVLSSGVSVVRGKRATHCFTLDSPQAVESEDLPPDVVSRAIGLTTLYEIHADGAAAPAVRAAVKFAKRVASASNGIMHDPQTDVVWPRTSARGAARSARSEPVDIVEFSWFAFGDGSDLTTRYLAAAGRHLPEAIPRRFGSYEPMQGKVERDGVGALLAEVASGGHTIYFAATYPVTDGSFSNGADFYPPLSFSHVYVSIPRPVLEDPDWRSAVRAFFLDIARHPTTVFACAEVVRHVGWTGWSSGHNPGVEERFSLIFNRKGWMGLPPHPVWWSYFGRDYAGLVRDHLLDASLAEPDGAWFTSWSDEPQDRDTLAGRLDSLRPAGLAGEPWVPQGLLGVLPPRDGQSSRFLEHAAVIPAALRHHQP